MHDFMNFTPGAWRCVPHWAQCPHASDELENKTGEGIARLSVGQRIQDSHKTPPATYFISHSPTLSKSSNHHPGNQSSIQPFIHSSTHSPICVRQASQPPIHPSRKPLIQSSGAKARTGRSSRQEEILPVRNHLLKLRQVIKTNLRSVSFGLYEER